MKNLVIIGLLAFIGMSANLPNETKIGYVYMEMVMNNMPETIEMMATIEKFTAEKQREVNKRNKEIEDKKKNFELKSQSGELSEAGIIILQNELNSLKKELDLLVTANEQELYAKRSALLMPIAKKLEKTMDEVAAQKGYRYVFSSADGTGNSIVVVAPEADDLTQEVMEHLGIKLK